MQRELWEAPWPSPKEMYAEEKVKPGLVRCYRCSQLVEKNQAAIFPADLVEDEVAICSWCEEALFG